MLWRKEVYFLQKATLYFKFGVHSFRSVLSYHKPNWEETKQEEWEKIVNSLVQKPSWIMDGTYNRTMDIRIKSAGTIIYLDYPTLKCFWRVIIRIFKHHGVTRSDMANGCKEQFDLEFLHYVLTFNSKFRKGIKQKLNLVKDKKKVLILKTNKQADKFLTRISAVK